MSRPEMSPQPPPYSESNILVSFPLDHVLQITMNRTATLNAMTPGLRDDIGCIMDWFENEPTLWVCILTGAGRAFSTGMDLAAWSSSQQPPSKTNDTNLLDSQDPLSPGVGSISKRRSKKPLIAAVNGFAVGGGFEMVLNCDVVVASEQAKFGFPEVSRGVSVSAGGIPRLVKVAGHQLAAELLFTGRLFGAIEARDRFRFVNVVVPSKNVLATAQRFAQTIAKNSPDAIQSTKRGIIAANETSGFDAATHEHVMSEEHTRLFAGENVAEGLKSFVEKRKPVWVNPKL